jgi:hypothetical protein
MMHDEHAIMIANAGTGRRRSQFTVTVVREAVSVTDILLEIQFRVSCHARCHSVVSSGPAAARRPESVSRAQGNLNFMTRSDDR